MRTNHYNVEYAKVREVQGCEFILFNWTEFVHEIPHCGSIFRNSRFKPSHCPVLKKSLLSYLRQLRVSPLLPFFFTAPLLSSKYGMMAGFMEYLGADISAPPFSAVSSVKSFLASRMCNQPPPCWREFGGICCSCPQFLTGCPSAGNTLQVPCLGTTPQPISHQHSQHFEILHKIFLKILDLASCHVIFMRNSQADMCEVCFRYFFI